MNRTVVTLFVAFVICLLPLGLGMESLLLLSLPGPLPLGTLLAAVALVLGALIPVVAKTGLRVLRRAGWAALVLALPWLPAGVTLSGSAELNFGPGSRGSDAYWAYTVLLAVGVVMLVNATAVVLVWRWWRWARDH